jgi:hypothetical protein
VIEPAPVAAPVTAAPPPTAQVALAAPVASPATARKPAARKPAVRTLRPARAARVKHAARAVGPMNWAIQLGAYNQKAAAQENWAVIARTVRAVAGRPLPILSSITVNGKVMYRLSIDGFAEFNDAETTCYDLRAQRLRCIVRRRATLGTIEPLNAKKN